ncbi:hypothetical protein GHJ37_11435 [Glaesserella parasuis]|nr:hypothetical protein [Glaesserella parasuis]
MKQIIPELYFKVKYFDFITMEEQRFHNARNPLSLYSPIIQNNTHIFNNETCAKLFSNFMNRTVLRASTGKQKDGSFSKFVKIYSNSKNWGRAFSEYTHFTFTVKFTDRYNNATELFPVLIVDIDDFDGDYSVFEKFDLTPNYLIRNPKKQKSLQVGYVLATPVFKLEDKDFFDYRKLDKNGEPLPLDNQSKQIKFIETVIRLNELFNGDTNFKLHNAKNPFFFFFFGAVAWTELPPYSVDELFNRAFADRYNPKFADVDFTDIENHILTEVEPNEHYKYDENSRNCQLFDEMRLLAYEVSSEYVETKATKEFFTYLFNVANSKNREIGLPENEVKAMIRSIVKYCFRNELVCKYPSYQQRRLDKMNQIKTYMLDTYGPNHKYSKAERILLTEKFEVAEKTISTYASQIRKEHGTLKDEKARLLHEIQTLRNTYPPVKWARIAEMLNMTEDNVRMMYKRGTKEQ